MSRIFLLCVYLFSNTALACSCDLGTVSEKFKEFDSVFAGEVESIEYTGAVNELNEPKVVVKFKQIKRFKGKAEQVTLHTQVNSSSCLGYWFKPKDSMLIYAFEKDGKFNVYWCGGAVSKSESPELYQSEFKELEVIVSSSAL